MTELRVSELWRYPIKGCAGERCWQMDVWKNGFKSDRRWMVVDENGMFVTQRGQGSRGIGIRSMCLVKPKVSSNFVHVTAPNMPPLVFPLNARLEACDVQVWDWQGRALEVALASSDWFTEYLSRERPGKYRLVQKSEETPRYAKGTTVEFSFADGYPFLVISQESLDMLNKAIDGGIVPMNRFRPNIVLSGGFAHEEDAYEMFLINGVVFKNEKRCDRCAVPSYNQETGEIDTRPLRALANYRLWSGNADEKKIKFGSNYTHMNEGTVHEDSRVKVLSYMQK